MATFNATGIEGLDLSLEEFAAIPDNVVEEMLDAAGQVVGYRTEYPLIWNDRSIYQIEEIGIKRPKSYSIFNHANCIGCLKAGKQHWFIVYCLYPEIWEKAKQAEKKIGFSILRQAFLFELEPEFARLKQKALPPTEKITPQKFWAVARKLIQEEDVLPCDCSF